MKQLTQIVLTLTIIITTNGFAFSQSVECSYDNFKGISTCNVSKRVQNIPNTDINAALISGFISSNNTYLIILTVRADTWQYINEDKFYFLVDGNRVRLKSNRVNSEVNSGNVSAQYVASLTKNQFIKFENADVIKFKFGGDVYNMSDLPLKKLIKKYESFSKKHK